MPAVALAPAAATQTLGGDVQDLPITDVELTTEELLDRIERQKRLVVQSGLLHFESCQQLGELLREARGRFTRKGAWGGFLERAGIDPDRAERFMTIADPQYSADLRRMAAQQDLAVTTAVAIVRQRRQKLVLEQAQQALLADVPIAEPASTWRIWQADAAATGLQDGAVRGLILFSPPYCVGKEYEAAEDIDWASYADRVHVWAHELWRIAGDRGRLAVNVANDIWDQQQECPRDLEWLWKTALYAAGWSYRWTIDWIDGNGSRTESSAFGTLGSANAPHVINPVERVIVCHKGPWHQVRHEPGDLSRDEHLAWHHGVWNLGSERPRRVGHPAPFPEALPHRLIKLLTYSGDVVYDPFCGSGTTPAVAHELGRLAWGSDIWDLAVELSSARLARCDVRRDGPSWAAQETERSASA